MSKTAYQLKESYKSEESGEFGGSLALADGTTFDVGKTLASEEFGPVDYIVVEDELQATSLDNYPALKRSSLPDESKDKPAPKAATKSPADTPKVAEGNDKS